MRDPDRPAPEGEHGRSTKLAMNRLVFCNTLGTRPIPEAEAAAIIGAASPGLPSAEHERDRLRPRPGG
jgi:hypothetical protein